MPDADHAAGPRVVRTAGFFRRLGAMAYDALLLFAILLVASIPLAFLDGQTREWWPVEGLIRLYLLAVSLGYFVGSWHRGGQTLGMRAWRLRLVAADGGRARPRQLLRRFAAALLSWLPAGLGYLWILFDPERAAWHDRLSATVIVHEKP